MAYLKVFLESPSVEFLPAYKGVLENHRSLQAVDMPICIPDSAIALVWLRLQPHNCPHVHIGYTAHPMFPIRKIHRSQNNYLPSDRRKHILAGHNPRTRWANYSFF